MSRSRTLGQPQRRTSLRDYPATIDDRWQSFIAFWLVAGLALLGLGIVVFAAVRHGHRLAGVIVLAGIVSLAIGLSLRRVGRGAD